MEEKKGENKKETSRREGKEKKRKNRREEEREARVQCAALENATARPLPGRALLCLRPMRSQRLHGRHPGSEFRLLSARGFGARGRVAPRERGTESWCRYLPRPAGLADFSPSLSSRRQSQILVEGRQGCERSLK